MTATATGSGEGFIATGSGGLTVTGTTSVETNTGRAINISGQNIVGGATFQTVDVTAGTTSAVTLTNVTGSTVTIGSGTNPGDGGSVTNSNDPAIVVDNATDVVMENITVNNAATTGGGLQVINNTGGTRTFSGLDISTRDVVAVDVNSNSGGTNTLSDLTANSSAGASKAVNIQNQHGRNSHSKYC